MGKFRSQVPRGYNQIGHKARISTLWLYETFMRPWVGCVFHERGMNSHEEQSRLNYYHQSFTPSKSTAFAIGTRSSLQ